MQSADIVQDASADNVDGDTFFQSACSSHSSLPHDIAITHTLPSEDDEVGRKSRDIETE